MPCGTSRRRNTAEVAIDASALVDLLLGNDLGRPSGAGSWGTACTHRPTSMPGLSALGRLYRAGELDAGAVETNLHDLAPAPVQRHPVNDLLLGAWGRRHQLRLADALYVELAAPGACR